VINEAMAIKKIFVQPGYVCIPEKISILCGVAGSGVIVVLHDVKERFGGMCYFVRYESDKSLYSSTYYASPALISLIKELEKKGSKTFNMEAHVYGGAENRDAKGFVEGLGVKNIAAAENILMENNISISGKEIGGNRGRKVVFNSGSGEIIVAKVDNIREHDWYPDLNFKKRAT